MEAQVGHSSQVVPHTAIVATERRPRALSIEGLCNARDLGGLPRVGGGQTPYRTFFRSENLHAVTPRGWRQLRGLGVRTVVDLRQPAERSGLKYARYQPPAWLTVRQIDHDGLDDHPEFWSDYGESGMVGTPLYYLAHLRDLPERSAAVLSTIARAPKGAVLFHCAGGRDRTGIIAMLLLTIAGADHDAIVDDYLESVRNGAAVAAARGRPDSESACEELCRKNGTTTEGAFREALVRLDVGPLVSLLGEDEREMLTTWRGSLQ